MIVKMLFLVLSCVIIAIGFSLLKATDLGVAPNDIIPFIISDKLKLEYRVVRIALDVIFVVVGFLFGGVVGVGTIIGALLTGPLIQFFMPRLEKLVHIVVYNYDKLESIANETTE